MNETPRKRRRADPQPERAPHRLPDDLRRTDAPEVPSEEIPPPESGEGLVPAGGGYTPEEDGGNENHPMHDADPDDDADTSIYEREVSRVDAATKRR